MGGLSRKNLAHYIIGYRAVGSVTTEAFLQVESAVSLILYITDNPVCDALYFSFTLFQQIYLLSSCCITNV